MKNIYSLKPLREILTAANFRYIEFISAIDDNTIGHKKLEKATATKKVEERDYKGLNFFSKDDKKIVTALARGEYLWLPIQKLAPSPHPSHKKPVEPLAQKIESPRTYKKNRK